MSEAAPIVQEETRRTSPILWIILILLAGLVLGGLYVYRARLFANNALFHLNKHNTVQARSRLDQARQLGLDDPRYYSLLLRIQAARGEYAEALQSARALLKTQQFNLEDAILAAQSALETNNAQAMRFWLPILEKDPRATSPVRTFARGLIEGMNGNTGGAIERLDKLRTDDPALQFINYYAALYVAQAYRQGGDPAEALRPLELARSHRPAAIKPIEEEARCWRDMNAEAHFRYELDVLRSRKTDPAALIEEMRDCADWIRKSAAGTDPGIAPSQLTLYCTEMPLPDEQIIEKIITALFKASQTEALIALGRNLEINAGPAGRNQAARAYKQALATDPRFFAAGYHLRRMQTGNSRPESAKVAEALARDWQFTGQWNAPAELRRIDGKPFDGGLYTRGSGIRIIPKTRGSQYLYLVASSDNYNGIGAWYTVVHSGKRERLYVDSSLPMAIQIKVFVPTDEYSEIQIWFANDERSKDGREDRNLYIHGVGLGTFPKPMTPPETQPRWPTFLSRLLRMPIAGGVQ